MMPSMRSYRCKPGVSAVDGVKFRTLTPDDFDDFMDLFVVCFQDDHCYRSLYPLDTAKCIRQAFAPILEQYLGQGMSQGAFRDGRLIGFLICFDYKRTRCENPDLFYATFGGTRAWLPYQKEIHDRVAALPPGKVYVLLIGVEEESRRNHIATEMMQALLEANPERCFASDVSNIYAMTLFEKLGFEKTIIGQEYWYMELKRCTWRLR